VLVRNSHFDFRICILFEILLGVYVKIEQELGDGETTYVSLDVYYTPATVWIGQILFTGKQPTSTPSVVVRYLEYPFKKRTNSLL
jgi:hypothetical protein